MKREDRKALAADYKERKVVAGIYVLRCMATGQQWAGRAPDVATIWNRLSFTLRTGANPHRTLQAAWREHGADAFAFDIVERVKAENLDLGWERGLRDRLAHWCATLGAAPI